MDFNPFSHSFQSDPYPTYKWLRENQPVYHNEQLNFWAYSQFTDVLAGLHDYGTYSSASGVAVEERPADDANGAYGLRSMIEMDPPVHTRYRTLLARRFTPRNIAALEPRVRTWTQALIEPLRDRDAFDVVADFSAILPTAVVAALLGIATEHHDDVRRWTDQLLTRDPDSAEISPSSREGQLRLAQLAGQTIAERRHHPSDDIISLLVAAEIDGRALTDLEITAYCVLLLSGGHETTSKLIAGGVRLFAQHPDQRAIACHDEEAMRRAVEELLRYTSPTQYMARTTTRDVTLHDTTVPAGAKVALLLGSGNRDPREFARPDDFEVNRPNKRILAFGHGAHACIGAAVARMEARVALDEFLHAIPHYTVDEDGIEYFHSGNVQGPAKVPVTVG